MGQILPKPGECRGSVVDFDTGIADRPDGDRQGDALQERKVHVDVEPLGLKPANRPMIVCNL
jgi:hypothetical protein